MKTLVIDTNVYCNAMRGEAATTKLLRQTEKIILPTIVIGELLSGFRGGGREKANRDQLQAFSAKECVFVASVTTETAEFYSLIIDQLRVKGTPVPTNDIWIAAIAMEQGAGLATQDGHFAKIDGLFLAKW